MDAAVPARLHAAAHPDLPPPRRRTRWAAWPRRSRSRTTRRPTRRRSPRCAPTSCARSTRRPRRHLGRAPRPRAGRARRSSTRTCRRPTSSHRQREDVHVDARPTCSRVPAGHAHRGRACATTSTSAIQYLEAWLRRQRLRAALQPDGGRGDRRDLAHAGLAVARTTARRSTTAAPVTAELFRALPRRGAGAASQADARRRALRPPAASPRRASLFERLSTSRRLRRSS